MEIVDANIVLRYLLNDNDAFVHESVEIVENKSIHLLNEVCAEIVYVLEKVYKVPRKEILTSVSLILDYQNITSNKSILKEALNIYQSENIDFVVAILVAYNHIQSSTIYTFDKKLKKLCS